MPITSQARMSAERRWPPQHGESNERAGVGFRRAQPRLRSRCCDTKAAPRSPAQPVRRSCSRTAEPRISAYCPSTGTLTIRLQPSPAPPWPGERMGKRIPDQVRGDAQHDGKQDSHETGRPAELEVSELTAQSSAAFRWAARSTAGRLMARETARARKCEAGSVNSITPGKLVAQAPIVGVADNVREVWSHAADHEGRPHQVQSAQGQAPRLRGIQ